MVFLKPIFIQSAFLEAIVSVATSLGPKELDEYILPLILMSISGTLFNTYVF